MESKSITLESSIKPEDYVTCKEKNRIRENARTCVEEFSRIQNGRVVSEITCAAHFGFTRPDLSTSRGHYILRRGKDYWKAREGHTVVGTCKIKGIGF